MKTLLTPLLLCLVGFSSFVAQAQAQAAPRYKDLAAWAARDTAGSAELSAALGRADTAPKIAAVLRAYAARQRKTTDELIALVKVHPELRILPELGLDSAGLQQWAIAHPNVKSRAVPAAAAEISQAMQRYYGSPAVKKNNVVLIAAVMKYRDNPEVVAAIKRLEEVLQDNRRRLLRTFS